MIEENYPAEFLTKLMKLRKDTTYENMSVCDDNNILGIKNKLLDHSGTMGSWVTDYLRDISAFLKSKIAAYRDKSMDLHLQAQRDLLPLLFAFNHPNYSRYLTYHHFELEGLKETNPSAYQKLKMYGMGASLTGRKFSTIPADLVTETTVNREAKREVAIVHGRKQ